MFYFPGYAPRIAASVIRLYLMGFPHSDISGSKVARHLPEAYRRHATSFIAFSSQGIHHTPLNFLLGNLKTACVTPPQPYKRSGGSILYLHHATVFDPNTVTASPQDLPSCAGHVDLSSPERQSTLLYLRYVIFKLSVILQKKTASLSGYELRPISGVWLWPRLDRVYLYIHSVVRVSILMAENKSSTTPILAFWGQHGDKSSQL